MFVRLGKWLVVLALVVSTGGHWVALQSVAWFGMAVTYSRTDSLEVALQKTFDGRHPCELCKTVEEGRKTEQKQATLKVETKFEFFFTQQAVTLPLPATENNFVPFHAFHSSRSDSPPTPPPRCA